MVKQKTKSTIERINDTGASCIPRLSPLCSELTPNITFLKHASEMKKTTIQMGGAVEKVRRSQMRLDLRSSII